MAASIQLLHLESDPAHAERVELALAGGGLTASLRRVATRAELAAALEGPVDAVVARQGADGLQGWDAVPLVHARLDVPVVVVCGSLDDECLVQAMRAGAADCVFEEFLPRLVPVLQRELRDRAERRHHVEVEDEPRRSGGALGALLDGALDAVVTVADDFKITGWNAQAERILGWSRDEALGRDFRTLMVPQDSQLRHERAVVAYRETGDSEIFHGRREGHVLRKDGRRSRSSSP
ncbi:MAG: PAS domain S-box protein [Deltaproteobacteria bacterium]|nr:PAS domain S-box protein [Deltaproteobacteria bacterium]